MNHSKRKIYNWLISGILLIALILIVGGITRITQSGLSIVHWKPISGVLPPLTEAEWTATFEEYKKSPEFVHYNSHFTMSDYKKIYFWEYIHRNLGRLIGLVFIIPFLFFWYKKYFTPKILNRCFIILLLGLSQGLMGWLMVKSGLSDQPHVSHFRLMFHLIFALTLISYIYYTALIVKYNHRINYKMHNTSWRKWVILIGFLIFLQIIYGAFVAGLDAGLMYNSFPKMGGYWFPPTLSDDLKTNGFNSLLNHPGTIQFIHRVLGTLLLIASVFFWFKFRKLKNISIQVFTVLIMVQFCIGIITLLFAVPIWLGVLHQFFAVLIVINVTHQLYKSRWKVIKPTVEDNF